MTKKKKEIWVLYKPPYYFEEDEVSFSGQDEVEILGVFDDEKLALEEKERLEKLLYDVEIEKLILNERCE